MRKYGIYNDPKLIYEFYSTEFLSFKAYINKNLSYIINFRNKFFDIMKVLRKDFKLFFLKFSKKLKKIKNFLISLKLFYNPTIINHINFKNFFIFKLPLVIHKTSPVILYRFDKFFSNFSNYFNNTKKINFKTYLQKYQLNLFILKDFYKDKEIDYSTGSFVSLNFYKNNFNKINIFWPIYIRFLYWRLYPM